MIATYAFWIPLGTLLLINLVFALMAAAIILIVEVPPRTAARLCLSHAHCMQPVAAGSGIPEVIAFLNGVKIPKIARFKTLIVKIASTVRRPVDKSASLCRR